MTAKTESGKTEFDVLPEGEYLLRMNRVTKAQTKKGDDMLKVSYQVVKKVGDEENESKTKNRLIFDNLILSHSNPKVEEITRDRVGNYLKAIGVGSGIEGIGGDFSKLEDYLESPFIGKVKIESGTNGYSDSNKVVTFKSR